MLPVCGILIKATDDNQTKARFLFVSSDRYVSAKKKRKRETDSKEWQEERQREKDPLVLGGIKRNYN